MIWLARRVSLLTLTGYALLCICQPGWAADGSIQAIQYNTASQIFEIDASGNIKATVNTLTIAGHKRIIIDLDNTEIGSSLPRDVQILQSLSRQLPSLKNITINQYAGNGRPIVRILMDIQGDPGVIRLIQNQGSRVAIQIQGNAPYYASGNNYSTASSNTDPLRQTTPIPGATYTSPATKPAQSVGDQSLAMNTISQQNTELRRTLATLNQKYDSALQQNQSLQAKLSQLEQSNVSQSQQSQSENDTLLQSLRQQLQSLQTSNSQIQTNLTSLLAEKRTLQEQLNINQSQMNTLRADNQALTRRLSQLNTAASATTSNSSKEATLKQSLNDLNLRYNNLLTENQSLQLQIAQIKSATPKTSSSADTDLQSLRKQVTVAQNSLNDAIRTINEQNKEIAYLNNQLNTLKGGMDSASRDQVNTLQAQLLEKEKALQSLKQQLAQKHNTQGQASASQGSELQALKQQISQLTLQHQADLQSLNQQLKSRNEQIARLQAENLQASDKASSSDKTLISQLTLQKQNLEQELKTLKARQQTANSSITELDKLKSQVGLMQSSLDSTQKQYQQAQAEAVAAKQALKILQESSKNNQSALKMATNDKATIAQLTQEKQSLTQELNTLKAQQQKSEQQASEASTSEVAKLKSQVALLQNSLDSTQKQYQQAQAEVAQAKQSLKALQEKPATNKTTAKAGSGDSGKQLTAINQQVASLTKENQTLKETLASIRNNSRKSAPSNTEAEQDYQAGKAALAEKKIDVALQKLKEATLLDEDNASYVSDYGTALAEDHQYAEAIDLFRHYLQRNPTDRDAYNQLGKIYLLNDQPEAASQAFTRAIPLSVLNNYATSLKKVGKTQDAESIFKLALSINPKDSEILFNLGNLYNAENKLEQARNKYLEALQIRPNFAEAHYNLGLIFSKLGDNAKAVLHLEKFLELSPNAKNAETIRSYVQKLKA